MKFECTDFDADFFAELDRVIAEAMIELEKDLAETEAEFEAWFASLDIEPLDIDLSVDW